MEIKISHESSTSCPKIPNNFPSKKLNQTNSSVLSLPLLPFISQMIQRFIRKQIRGKGKNHTKFRTFSDLLNVSLIGGRVVSDDASSIGRRNSNLLFGPNHTAIDLGTDKEKPWRCFA